MFGCPCWLNRLHEVWWEAPIAWLARVQRAGKSTRVRSLPADQVLSLGCDHAELKDMLKHPAHFYQSCQMARPREWRWAERQRAAGPSTRIKDRLRISAPAACLGPQHGTGLLRTAANAGRRYLPPPAQGIPNFALA